MSTAATDNSTMMMTEVVHLSECGTLGKQAIIINASSHITMTFHAARSAIGQRGFIIRVEGIYDYINSDDLRTQMVEMSFIE